ncbi:MAG TPA: cupredoxin domain-containing protein [Burkholderiaceae bacterium]|nr:cupredoxin domain-containing protein [Burkholderiaceae bacterium]
MTRLLTRRVVLQGAMATAGAAIVRAGLAQGAGEPRVIELTARRFVYEPSEITLKAGERVVIAIKSVDFVHGMNIPDLGKRLDLVPGRVTRLELAPTAPGVIDFVCDNFCGDGHEQMHGRFVVSA